MLKDLKEKKIYVYGDLEIVINQVKGVYQAKHPRMRAYRNLVPDLLEHFKEYHSSIIPREKNDIVDVSATFASVFKIPLYPKRNMNLSSRIDQQSHIM